MKRRGAAVSGKKAGAGLSQNTPCPPFVDEKHGRSGMKRDAAQVSEKKSGADLSQKAPRPPLMSGSGKQGAKGLTVEQIETYIRNRFQPHAIRGEFKAGRIYEVIEEAPTRLLIRTRNAAGTWRQTLEATLRTCKSLRHGEFRRVDLFWKWKHQGNGEDGNGVVTPVSGSRLVAKRPALRIVDRHPDGTPLAVDEFLGRGFGVFGDNQEESR